MDAIISYFIKSFIASGILYAYYLLALRNKKFHSYNRFYLLAAMVTSLAVPFINFNWFNLNPSQNSPLIAVVNIINPAGTGNTFHVTSSQLLFIVVTAISLVMLIILFTKVLWIYKIKRGYKLTRMNGFNLIETNLKQAPFSFLDNLFWKQSIAIDDENGKKIFKHELTHIREKHTYDKIFTQTAVCIFWMNPFYWFMQKELAMIHEFIADAKCVNEGDAEAFAMMLLQSHNEGRYLDPSHSFFHSPIKRRLIMITTSKKTPYSYIRRVLAIPLIATIVALFSVTLTKAQTDPKTNPGSVKVTNVKIEKKAGKASGDSLADVTILYVSSNGSPDTLRLKNVGFSKNDSSQNKAHILLEDGTEKELMPGEVNSWVKSIIQDPPNVLYYVNAKQVSRESIESLDPSKVTTANTYHGQDAITRYGDKAKDGVIVFTTK